MCCYPSDSKAAEINQAKFIPLLRRLPGIKDELQRPRTIRSDRIKMSNAVMYWQGSGSKIISKSCDCVFLDEIDQWSVENPTNVRDGWKRTRSFNSCMEIAVCSPTTQQGQIYQEFMKGSQGYYTLRCQKCRELTMRSCDVFNLQFESTYSESLKSYLVKKGTERLICPKCGFEHTEDMKRMMILEGEYVHLVPELKKERPSYQIGALASQLPALSWHSIADAQLEAGKTADISIQQNFDNSWRGLPYKPRQITKDEVSKLRDNHIWHSPPTLENVEMVFMTSDTMDDFSSYAVWAWGVDDSLYMLDCGEAQYIELTDEKRKDINEGRKAEGLPPIQTLEDLLMKDYLIKDGVGVKPTFMVIDQGGHRANDIKHFAKLHRNVIMQKGTAMSSMNWKMSENQERLIITNEKYWKSTFIYYLYAQKNREENYLWFYPEISDEHIAEIRDVKPDETSKWGHEPRKLGEQNKCGSPIRLPENMRILRRTSLCRRS